MVGGRANKQMTCPSRLGWLALAALLFASSAQAQLLPTGFFDNTPKIGSQNVAVTSDQLTYDANSHKVLADGDVRVDYDGYVITGDHLVFDQRAQTAHFVGQVVVTAPDKTVYRAPDMVLSKRMNEALMRQLTITTREGALVTAGYGDMQSGRQTVLTDMTYSPCGRCIDAKGHRIGWSAKATKMVYNNKTYNVTLTQPSLYLLGIPVAWLPWLSMPDPTKRLSTFRFPSYDSSPEMGSAVNLPYFIAAGPDTDILLAPRLMSRQGFLMRADVDHRFVNGTMHVEAYGVYQRDPQAFAPYTGADRTARGGLQTWGRFVPEKDWTVGWSYTAFTDPSFFEDYHLAYSSTVNNQLYATEVSGNQYLDLRVQRFDRLGDMTAASAAAAPARQALVLPNINYRNVLYLPGDMGELDLTGSLLGVQRQADDVRTTLSNPTTSPPTPVRYTMGFAEEKFHGMGELDWQKQFITPGGFAVTPFFGMRLDAATYNGASTLAGAPTANQLFNATPIAAVDVRFPMIARTGWATHVVEPIAQLVYRASDVTDVGITNDDSQSFILDDANLFSYNRFSGIDRQETGLRANVGGRYQLNFDNGGWLDLAAGESFHLAGTNAFDTADPTQVTTGQGMSNDSSYIVAGLQGSAIQGLVTGAKVQVDPSSGDVTRGGVQGTWNWNGYNLNANYLYVAANPARGILSDQHEIEGGFTVPVPFVDYWSFDAFSGWDIAKEQWLISGAGLHYNDGYLQYGVDVSATGPTNTTQNDFRVLISYKLKGLGGGTF
jgi:LPS-assembly protein